MPHGLAVEEPITSYFRRVSSTRNHKQSSLLVPSTAKRKRPQTSQTEDAKGLGKPSTRQKLAIDEASRTKTQISISKKTSSSVGRTASHPFRPSASAPLSGNLLLPLSSDIDLANKNFPANTEAKSPSTVRQATSGDCSFIRPINVHTPPPTIRPSKKHSTMHVQPDPLTPAVSRLLPHSNVVNSLPTPVMIARRIASSGRATQELVPSNHSEENVLALATAQPHGQTSTSGGNQVFDGSREWDRDEERNELKDPFADPMVPQIPVLSSQTQDVNIQPLQALTDLFPVASIFRLPYLPEPDMVVDNSDSDGFIHSSQSQHILPRHRSPRRKCADQLVNSTRTLEDESTLEEIVPSSQSQIETELNLSMRILDYFHHDKPGIRVQQTENSSHRNDFPLAGCPTRRTLSDELSPVPIQDMTLRNMVMTNVCGLVPLDPVDSATEDESEDELSMRIPSSGYALDAVTHGGEILEETASYINSLPNTVQDFEVMFDESSSGSLPGDFSTSSREIMVGRLQYKTALITGAGSGIGLESSFLFAQEGANVLLADINIDAAEKGATLITERFPSIQAIAIKTDVGKEADVKAAVEKAVKQFGRLDIMFNNAGIMHPEDDNALNTEERIWDLTMQINLKGVWWGCKYAIAAMRQNPVDEAKGLHTGGSIINTASFVAVLGAATPQLAYTASKGGVLAMTRELAMVHAREGIRINSLCPGPLKTPLLMDFLDTAEKRDRRLVHLPMGRFGEAVELAKAALFLASDDSSYVTGADFKVDGGLTSAYVTATGDPALAPPSSLLN